MKGFLAIVLMLALFFLLLFSKSLFAQDEPKFHYGDCVKVTSGFYKGCHGRISEYHEPNSFEVVLSCPNGGGMVTSFDSTVLSLQKQSACKDQ